MTSLPSSSLTTNTTTLPPSSKVVKALVCPVIHSPSFTDSGTFSRLVKELWIRVEEGEREQLVPT